jgi:hypothetical protein
MTLTEAQVREQVRQEIERHPLAGMVRELQDRFVGLGLVGRKVAFGVATVTDTGTRQANATVNHGMGLTPVSVIAVSDDVGQTEAVDTFNATSFRVLLNHVDGTAWTGTRNAYWIAVG